MKNNAIAFFAGIGFIIIGIILTPLIRHVKYKDYQIDVVQDSIVVYDGLRKVGTIPLGCDNMGLLILQDNQ